MKRKLKTLLCGLLALWLAAMAPLSATAETLEEIQTQQSQLEAENQQLQSRLESLRQDQAQKQQYQDTLQQQIQVVQEQILTTRENITHLNQSIQELTMKLDASQAAIQDTIDSFKERLVALYTAGNVGTLEILLDSKSLSEFTTRMTMVETMTSHDQELIGQLEAYMASTQSDREELQAQKEQVAQLRITLEQKQKELDALYQENREALGEIQGQLYATEDQMKINQEELAQGEARIQAAIEAQRKAEEAKKQQAPSPAEDSSSSAPQASSDQGGDSSQDDPSAGSDPPSQPASADEEQGTSSGGGNSSGFRLTWPLPGVSYVSAGWNGYPGHKGMDIAGPWGTPIVAAADGQVIEANSTDSWGYSWGYYVLVYHNGTYSTRYAHMSSVAVSTGQYVTAGTVLGYEGETGNAFGAHLHFEVYQNGTRVDPAQFL